MFLYYSKIMYFAVVIGLAVSTPSVQATNWYHCKLHNCFPHPSPVCWLCLRFTAPKVTTNYTTIRAKADMDDPRHNSRSITNHSSW